LKLLPGGADFEDCRPETSAKKPNLRNCRDFLRTGKTNRRDETGWLTTQVRGEPVSAVKTGKNTGKSRYPAGKPRLVPRPSLIFRVFLTCSLTKYNREHDCDNRERHRQKQGKFATPTAIAWDQTLDVALPRGSPPPSHEAGKLLTLPGNGALSEYLDRVMIQSELDLRYATPQSIL
jgi:hypothetical protein